MAVEIVTPGGQKEQSAVNSQMGAGAYAERRIVTRLSWNLRTSLTIIS